MIHPRSPHAVASIILQNPKWAVDSALVYKSGKGQATQMRERPAMQAERNSQLARGAAEERETD